MKMELIRKSSLIDKLEHGGRRKGVEIIANLNNSMKEEKNWKLLYCIKNSLF